MFVIADIEWATNRTYRITPTQLSAVKVDENWNIVDSFSHFIRPQDNSFYNCTDVAYAGGKVTDFLYAKSAYEVLDEFSHWCTTEDTLLWWHKNSKNTFEKFNGIILHKYTFPKTVIANDYVYSFISSEIFKDGYSIYKIAQSLGVETDNTLEHYSKDDALVFLEILKAINKPQKAYLKPIEKIKRKDVFRKKELSNPYILDKSNRTLHSNTCDCIKEIGNDIIGYADLRSVLKKNYKICPCITEEYKKTIRQRALHIANTSQYNYIFLPHSNVFHKHSCKAFHNSTELHGTISYYGAIKTGRVPCKICNPKPYDKLKFVPETKKSAAIKKDLTKNIPVSKEERKALKAQNSAAKVRKEKLKKENLSEQEISDIYTLTQSGLAFWAGQGYQNFHLRGCSKLHGVSNLKGFKSYEKAVAAGYTPCKTCRPTKKHNLQLSIPINNERRHGEKIESITPLCKAEGFTFLRSNNNAFIETPVGKWQINLTSFPIKIFHINLIKTPEGTTYHEQPRRFLSFADTFEYIKRHDISLIKNPPKEIFHRTIIGF